MNSMEFVDRRGRIVIKPADKKVAKRISAYGLYVDGGRVLLVKTTGGTNLWELPGGGLENNESLAEGLKREFMEETGYIIEEIDTNPLIHIKAKFYADDIDKFYNAEKYFFHIRRAISNGDFKDKNEIKKVARLRCSDINSKRVVAEHQRIIERFLTAENQRRSIAYSGNTIRMPFGL